MWLLYLKQWIASFFFLQLLTKCRDDVQEQRLGWWRVVAWSPQKEYPSQVTEQVLTVIMFTGIITGRLNPMYLKFISLYNFGLGFVKKTSMLLKYDPYNWTYECMHMIFTISLPIFAGHRCTDERIQLDFWKTNLHAQQFANYNSANILTTAFFFLYVVQHLKLPGLLQHPLSYSYWLCVAENPICLPISSTEKPLDPQCSFHRKP